MKKKILIADDDEDYVEILKIFLKYHHYDVLIAYEGVTTVEIARTEKPDLILLDLRMPAGMGNTVLYYLQSQPATKNIPIIVISGMSDDRLIEEVMSQGVKAFFKKPYQEEELLEQIRKLVGK